MVARRGGVIAPLRPNGTGNAFIAPLPALLQTARGVGAVSPRVNVNTTKFYLPDAIDENGLLKAEITAEAVGRPSPA